MARDAKVNDFSIKKRTIIDKVVIYVKLYSSTSDNDVDNDLRGSIQKIKNDVKKVIEYDDNTTNYQPDGSIVITPRYLKQIPNEIISLIIDYLGDVRRQEQLLLQNDGYECSLINRQFYATTNLFLWQTPIISNNNTLDRFIICLANANFEQKITTRSDEIEGCHTATYARFHAGHHIRRLNLQGKHWGDIEFTLILPFISLLEELTIDRSTCITSASLTRLPRYCPHLTSISTFHTNLDEPCFNAIAQHCYQIRQLDLKFDGPVSDGIFNDCDCARLRSLTRLNLHSSNDTFNNTSRTSHTRRYFSSDSIIADIVEFDQLTHISLGVFTDPLTHSFFTKTTAWPRLSSLTIANANNLDDGLLNQFLRSHLQLCQLRLYQTQISDAGLVAIGKFLPRLTHLVLSTFFVLDGVDGIYPLVKRCQYLKQADFPNCTITNTIELSSKKELTLSEMKEIRQR